MDRYRVVNYLIYDWRWGDLASMAMEEDGDLAANIVSWQWSARRGMDSNPPRIFNPATQATKFDTDEAYIWRWMPELRQVNTKDPHTGYLERMVISNR